MITGIDHVVIAVRDLDGAVRAYETLLGRRAGEREHSDGVARAMIATGNTAVELMAPVGESEGAARLRAALETGEGLKSLVLAVSDIESVHRRAERVGLSSEAIASPEHVRRRSFRLSTQRTNGVRMFCIDRAAPPVASDVTEVAVLGLDHVVIRSGDMERAAALYGARLGLDMRLDRMVMGRRLMFFRCGDAIVEIAEAEAGANDALWGLSGAWPTRRWRRRGWRRRASMSRKCATG